MMKIQDYFIFFFKGLCYNFTMFGNLFDEDFSFLSNNQCGKQKSKHKDAELLVPRESTNLSGIKNQGGTCYLNSLLQTLLFTPEFRGTVQYFNILK